MRSRSGYGSAVIAVAALLIASAVLLTTPAEAAPGEIARAGAPASDTQKLTPLQVHCVTRRGLMVEVRGRTDPRAEVTINGRSVPLIARDGSFTFFLTQTPREQSGGVTVSAQVSGSLPNTLTLKPNGPQ